jgi:L-asparaginase II
MSRVDVWRGPLIESTHRVHVAVVDADGRLRAGSGETARPTFARSAIKPIQALPLVEDGAAAKHGFGDRELALCCASHNGEPHHVEGVRAMLERIGLEETALACGPHPPFHGPSAKALDAAGQRPGRIHNNCSGKHAGMLALARFHDWPVAAYNTADHPVQRRMLDAVMRWTEVREDDIPIGIDGCGVVTFGLTLHGMAGAFARLAAGARKGGTPAAIVLGAMKSFPESVAGTDRMCTDLMRAVDGRIVAKTGAEGVYCAAIPGAELGIALKVEDGARRAAEPALVAVLRSLGLLSDREMGTLSGYAEPEIRNTRGELAGRIRAVIELETGVAGVEGGG